MKTSLYDFIDVAFGKGKPRRIQKRPVIAMGFESREGLSTNGHGGNFVGDENALSLHFGGRYLIVYIYQKS